MSDELEWELYDVFEAGLFPFPIYDHQTARKIIRYLLYRGALDEEIADAIEDSTADLHLWLNRRGKNMVGEWVIAWLNENREEYSKEKKREARERGYSWHDHEVGSEESSHSSDDGSSSDGDDACMATSLSSHFASSDAMRKWAARMQAIDDSNTESSYEEDEEEFEDRTDVKRPQSLSPPPSPPPMVPSREHNREGAVRAAVVGRLGARVPLEMLHMQCSLDSAPPSSEISPRSHHHLSFSDDPFHQQTPDSGAVSDIYSLPPSDPMDTADAGSPYKLRTEQVVTGDYQQHKLPVSTADSHTQTARSDTCSLPPAKHIDDSISNSSAYKVSPQNEELVSICHHQGLPVCTTESHIQMARSGIPSCPSCRCSVVHYSVIPKPTATVGNPQPTGITSTSNATTTKCNSSGQRQMRTTKQETLGLFLSDVPVSAMDFHMETLDREGPGYIFIMTDSTQNFLPWSTEYRYKIASSRQPERWLAEFRNRDIDMELVWQVKVRSHLRALTEVHLKLIGCKLHSDWFKCSLSMVMDTISRVVRKYKI